jgi:3-phenylpropionate/trans-cinnamate dioxygenase ferredoxin reductase subunit
MPESTNYLLVGGGLASVWAAQNIRERDKEGRLIIVGEESRPPYDKPPLSKNYIADDEIKEADAYSKFDNFYPDNNIELMLGSKATKLDPAAHTVTLENGTAIRYEKLLLCTGADPKTLAVPGSDLKNVFYLRKLDESLAIRAAIRKSKRIVLAGAGYLNLEVGSGALKNGLNVTYVEPTGWPWSRFASPKLGQFMTGAYEKAGAKFHFNDSVTAFTGDGSISSVTTKTGAQIACDMAVIAVGATLNTELAKDAGLKMGDRGGVIVNEFLQTSDPDIYAAGDIACFQDIALGKQWHAEHHLNAKWQGRAVGAIMAGDRKPYDQVPYFFSDFLDLHMVQRGDPAVGRRDDTTILGDSGGGEFVELYPDDSGMLRMGVAISHEESKLDPISDKLEELIRAKAQVAGLTPESVGLKSG